MYKKIQYIFLLFFSLSALARPSIEEVRDSIIKTLAHHNPCVLEQFNCFYAQFDSSVHAFFDKKNHQSLADHIKRIEGEADLLGQVCSDLNFSSVCAILRKHRAHVLELIAILKKYVGSINSVGFALNVKRFEFLLPDDIKKRGHISLFRSLHHRLMC